MNDDRKLSPVLIVFVAIVLLITAMVVWNGAQLFFGERVAVELPKAAKQSATKPREDNDSDVPTPAVAAATTSVPSDADALLAMVLSKLTLRHAVPHEAVLTFHTKGDLAQFLRQANGYGLKLLGTIDRLNAVRVGFENADSLRDYMAKAGKNAPSLEANQWFAVPRLPKDDANNQQGATPVGDAYLAAINANGNRSDWGQGITVAVLDTGVLNHPTFSQGQVTHVDLVNDGQPDHSHGTSVASLIAGQDDQVPGVAPGAHILDIRVANSKGMSTSNTLAQGIVEAVDRGAALINISMGGADDSALLREAVAYALQRNVFIIAAAGNEHQDQLAYPAAIPGVISIGSVDGDNKQAYFSNSGNGLSFVAPGVGLPTAWDTDKVASVSGTSQSTGVASGVIAAYLSHKVSAQYLLQQLQKYAKATGAAPAQVGNGVIQIPPRW